MTQIIYLPPAHTPRLTNIQLVSYAISLAVGIMGLTVAITTAIKVYTIEIKSMLR